MADYNTRYGLWLSEELHAQIYMALVDTASYWADPGSNASDALKQWVRKYIEDPSAMAIRMAPLILGRSVVKDAEEVRDIDVKTAIDQVLAYFLPIINESTPI